MELKVFQKGFNYSQDGVGNRLVLHLQGCNMRCPWCSNPEGMDAQGQCKRIDVNALADECLSCRPMFFDGGGVTLTGGEVSMQLDAVLELLKRLKEENIHTCIETNASHPEMEKLVPFVDQWIMDVKHYNDDIHRQFTGVSNRNTIKTLKEVVKLHRNVLVRVPLIPGFNDGYPDAEEFAKLFCACGMDIASQEEDSSVRVEFLKYHEFGKSKWEKLGLTYQMPHAEIPEEKRRYFEDTLESYGVKCIRT